MPAVNLDAVFAYLPYLVGCGVALFVFGFFVLRRRSSGRYPPLPPPRAVELGDQESSFADRRSSLRREGPPVRIIASSPSFRGGIDNGYVLDRSTTGLRIALTVPIAAGSMMQIRAENAPDTVPWVTVLVRNCRNAGQHYELGCEFDKTPPWNVLLLFG